MTDDAWGPLLDLDRGGTGELDDHWAVAVVRLSGQGRIPRAELVRMLIDGMCAGGRVPRALVTAYRLLDLTTQELHRHRDDFLAMLDTAAAGTALQALRALDDAGRLEPEVIAQAGRTVLRRGGKRLVRAQLAWLDKALARHPRDAGLLLDAVAAGLADEDAELAGRALRILRSHPATPRAGRLPPPIATVADLAAALEQGQDVERILAATAGLAFTCRASMTAAFGALGSMLDGLTGVSAMTADRVRELSAQLGTGGPPVLLATPATRDGFTDPARLLFRLAEAERDGWQPGPYDLAQALLRLPRDAGRAIVGRADRLVSPAGRRFARWLRAGGLPDPVVTVETAADGHRAATFLPLRADPWVLTTARVADPEALPGHREIVAAQGGFGTARLARMGGPFGAAMALRLAYGLGDGDRDTVAAVLLLDSGNDLDAALVGRELTLLLAGGVVDRARVDATLEAIERAGGGQVVRAITHEVVPALIRAGEPRPSRPAATRPAARTAARRGS
nr:hypothetical protein [uncultured Actinoplanes sp.]